MPDVSPIDQGAILSSGRALAGDYAADMIRRQLAGAQTLSARTNADQEARLLAHDQDERTRRDQFGVRARQVLTNPTMGGISGLIADFPEYHQPLKQLHDMTDQSQRDTDLQQLSEIFGALANDAPDVGARRLRTRIDAERAAGLPVEQEEAVAAMLESGDPSQILHARGMLAYELANRMGPEHFAGALERLQSPEAQRYAESLGLTPGTPAYRSALQDYVLRGSGPTAHSNDVALEGVRQEHRVEVESVQHGYRSQEQGVQHGYRSAEIAQRETDARNRPPSNVLERIRRQIAAGQPLTPGQQRIWDSRPGQGARHGRAGGPAPTEGAIIRNAQGHRMQLRGGQWVPIQ